MSHFLFSYHMYRELLIFPLISSILLVNCGGNLDVSNDDQHDIRSTKRSVMKTIQV